VPSNPSPEEINATAHADANEDGDQEGKVGDTGNVEEQRRRDVEGLRENLLPMSHSEEMYRLALGPQADKMLAGDAHRIRVLNAAIEKLTRDIYNNDYHFIFELIQNADDNKYAAGVEPSLMFALGQHGLDVLNNELGFTLASVSAVSDIGKSTKVARGANLIGRKGMGFKAVFAVADKPAIFSNGYQFHFDKDSEPKYILPSWVDEVPAIDPQEGILHLGAEVPPVATPGVPVWRTLIRLGFSDNRHGYRCSRELDDVCRWLLLFLNRLKRISIADELGGHRRSFNCYESSKMEVAVPSRRFHLLEAVAPFQWKCAVCASKMRPPTWCTAVSPSTSWKSG